MKARTNAEWISDLRSTGDHQATALADLRTYLLQAALYAFSRERGDMLYTSPAVIEQLAEDCAQDALMAILKHLADFRGESKFTTWAYKFAINLALVAARREIWRHVSLDQLLDDPDFPEPALREEAANLDPDRAALQYEAQTILREAIEQELTDRQRQALKAIVFDEVPLDEVARRLGSNRNAIYKLLHDARRKLKACLIERGFGVEEVVALFSPPR